MVRRKFKPLSCDLDQDGPESVHRAVTLAQLFSTTNGLNEVQAAKLAILIEEAVTNLYDHGAIGSGFCGRVDLGGDDGGLLVIVCDSGEPFDLRDVAGIDMPNPERGGGVGLAMIRAWADVVGYSREGAMNRLELRMRH